MHEGNEGKACDRCQLGATNTGVGGTNKQTKNKKHPVDIQRWIVLTNSSEESGE
jgi:hypothetical protein